ncbi:hypothetical protein C7S17_4803 [Burkholderia thailandensis]|nr:hypothetical protein [Burkholderia thailandensis]
MSRAASATAVAPGVSGPSTQEVRLPARVAVSFQMFQDFTK